MADEERRDYSPVREERPEERPRRRRIGLAPAGFVASFWIWAIVVALVVIAVVYFVFGGFGEGGEPGTR